MAHAETVIQGLGQRAGIDPDSAVAKAMAAVAPALVILVAQAIFFPVPLGIWVLGAVLGLLTALVALGMALVYRASRILNFAQADLGFTPTVLAATLITEKGLNYFVGFGLGLVAAIACGALVELLIIRRFFKAPRLILTVATIGLSQLFTVISLLIVRTRGVQAEGGTASAGLSNLTVRAPFSADFSIGTVDFSSDYLVALVVAPVLIVGLALFLRSTAVGIALRASAERADRASLLGVPVKRLQMLVWALAAALSYVGLFLRAGVVSVPAISLFSFGALAVALAALMLGRLTNLAAIAAAAVALGVLERAVDFLHGPVAIYPVLAVVILVALVGRRIGTSRAEQDVSASWQAAETVRPIPRELRHLPEVAAVKWGGAAVLLAAAVAWPARLSASGQFRASTVAAYALIGLSIVVLTGWAGQVSLGQMSFAAVGAALAAVGTATWGIDFSLTVLIAGVAGAAVAVVVGIPALRLRGLFLAVTTLAFALAAFYYLLSSTEATWIPSQSFEAPLLFNYIDLSSELSRYYVCLGALLLALIALQGVRRSRTGRVLVALRENEAATQAYGVSVVRAKLVGFALSGFLAAVGGALLAMVYGDYIDATYAPTESFTVFTATVVGGVGSLAGALLSAAFLDGGRAFISSDSAFALLPSALGVLIVLLVVPGGLANLAYRGRDALLRVVARRRGITVPSLMADTGDSDLLAPAVAQTREPAGEQATDTDAGDGVAPAAAIAGAEPDAGALLSVRELDVKYGDVQVLFGVDLDVRRGEIIALLGTNGAGKSTLLKAISGIVPASGGAVRFDDDEITKTAPEHIAALGISQVPGGQGVFPSLTVAENLRVAGWLQRRDLDLQAEQRERALELFPTLRTRLDDPAANLSGGQQQMLALSMAFLSRPALLAIDELSLGLAPVIVDQLLGIVQAMRDDGTTILLVEQSVNVALTVAETAYFMEKGQIRFHGPTAELLHRPDVLRSVFLEGAAAGMAAKDGNGHDPSTPKGRFLTEAGVVADSRVPALSVRGLSVHFGGIRAVDDVDFDVEAGEIVGMIGPNGAGKTTVFDLVSGFTPSDAGRVELSGIDLTRHTAPARARLGIGRSFQDARLFPALTVSETLAVALEGHLEARDPFNAMFRMPVYQDTEARAARRVDELIELLGIGDFRDKFVSELSTGSRRVVDLACVIAHRPSVVLLDEPSSGIAQREAEALGPLLQRIRTELGASLIVIEHDIALVTSVADRLVALDQGRVVTAGPPDDVLHHPEVVASYLGTEASPSRSVATTNKGTS